eukprot:7180780-Karenia_brevis.AAC.1
MLAPAPLPGSSNRQQWKATFVPCGPIGLLLQFVHYMGATLDFDSFTLRSPLSFDINVIAIPYQLLKPTILSFAADAVHSVYSQSRTILKGAPNLDTRVFRAATRNQSDHYTNVIHAVATLSTVDQSILHRFVSSTSEVCPYCRSCVSSVHHMIWFCTHPKLVAARQAVTHPDQHLMLQCTNVVPIHLLYGIPTKLTLLPATPWWTNDAMTSVDGRPFTSDEQRLLGIDTTYPLDGAF